MVLPIDILRRMMHEYYEGFEALFTDGEIRLRRILKQKLRAINLCEKGLIDNDHEEQFKTKFKNTIRITNDDHKHKINENEDSEK